ncbi:hypothetical protein A2680_02170 [Candidatus Kaiserbacteria bacterium RIFCSPHIGHO2_01_FULL_55_37]|nr:MAG: hypothetical protein A2680_02170 [Candidatus Kaiserbacteria bacterium RIFCSPHIGHO2_01_FULL_55_37]
MSKEKNKSVMYSGAEEVERTLHDEFLPEALRKSRHRELRVLQERLRALSRKFEAPLRIFDIGIGDGYVPLRFDKELLQDVEQYVGIDNSPQEVQHCKRNVRQAGLTDKIKTFEFDAIHLEDALFRQKLPLPFHAIISTWFTPGNFRPDEIKLEWDDSGRIVPYPKRVLEPNEKFQEVFSDAYDLLASGGELILGSTYIDSPATRIKQEEFYKNCGMHVITSEDDTFTATQEGFWSQRFTEERIYSYLNWVTRGDIELIPINTDGLSRMVVVTKS